MKKAEYDAFADHFSATRQRPWPEFSLLEPHLQKFDRVLDLGCGNGRLRQFLPADVIPPGNYFGLDISQNLLDIARDQFPQDHFFRRDFSTNFLFGAENFEVVTAIASFHHLLSRKAQLRFLDECRRVLKPGGTLFMTTWKLPDTYFWPNVLRGRFKNWNIPFGPDKHPRTYRRTDEKELAKLLKKAGFEVLDAQLYEERNYVVIGRKGGK